MKLFNTITLLFIVFVFVSGCKKYPDGPLINLESKISRLRGTWDVEYFGINGNDSTLNLKNWPYYGDYEFSSNEDGGHLSFTYLGVGSLSQTTSGYWEFQDRKNNLFIVPNRYWNISTLPSYGAYAAPAAEWEIRKLIVEQLWIRTVYRDGREYFIKFKRVHT